MKRKEYKEYILPLFLIFMPFFIMVSLIFRYGINVPFWDHWELVPLLHKLYFGKLTFYDLWMQSGNEHRILFPKIIMLTLAYISNWNIWYELYTNLVFGGIILVFLYFLLNHTFNGYNKKLILYFTAVFSFLVFSPVQWLSYIHGWKFQMFLATLSPVVTVWAITRYPNNAKGMLIAILSTVIGSYSYITCLLIWITSGVLLFQSKKNWKYIVIWFISAGITIILYFYKFTRPEKSLLSFINYPLYFLSYIISYLGAPLSFENLYISLVMGVFLIITLVLGTVIICRYYKQSFPRIIPWLSFALYVLLTAIVTAIGRLGKGEFYNALWPHYTTISTLFVISVFVITVVCIENYLKENKEMPIKLVIPLTSICTLIVLSYILTFSHGIKRARFIKKAINSAEYCLHHPDKCDNWKILYPDPKGLLERIKMLEQIPFKGGIKDTKNE